MVMLSSDLEMLYSVTSLSVGSLYFVFLFTLSEVSVDASHLLRVEHWCNIGVLSLRACSVNNCGVWGLFFLPVFSCLNRVLGWLFSLFMLSFGLGSDVYPCSHML